MANATDGPVNLLADLTPAQAEAVTHLDGPLLILAAAGSGKTRVITRRVAWLLQQGVRPWNILAITFTNKAAGEMRQRVETLVPGNRVLVSTFHALGARLLRQYADRIGVDSNFTIYDTADRNKLIKDALEAAGLDNARFTPERVGSAISKAKNQLQAPKDYAAKAFDFFSQAVAKTYSVYEKRLRDANALDFDDLLYLPAAALRENKELRAELDAKFKYLLVDEYQDTNYAQYALARSLSVDHPNLCVVGDPDQSIYGWRGSDIKNILDFERDYPNTRVITLDRNYRSTKNILLAADTLIGHNLQRKKKSLLTDNDAGPPVRVLTFDTGLDEAEMVVRRIKDAVGKKEYHYRDVAIFVRMNALTRTLESAFVKHGVPFQIVKGLAFFDRKENKDVIAYLRLIVNPQDSLSFLRVVNEPPRGIGKVTLERLQSFAESHEMSLLKAASEVNKIMEIKGKSAKALFEFAVMIAELRQHLEDSPDAMMTRVLDRTGYREMLKSSSDADDQDRLANIEELITAAKQFTTANPDAKLGDFLEQITLASDIDNFDEQSDCVSVMTLHAAKGLEFPVVYMLAVEQGILPHERSLQRNEEVEEERRLCFVGMTRAKQLLHLCHAKLREFRGQALYTVPSMFFDELAEDAVERLDLCARSTGNRAAEMWRGGGNSAASGGWNDTGLKPVTGTPTPPDEHGYAVGVNVQHEVYGKGRIIDMSGNGALRKLRIRFATAGEKSFIADKVKLRILTKDG